MLGFIYFKICIISEQRKPLEYDTVQITLLWYNKKTIVKCLWLWPIADFIPPDHHLTKENHALLYKTLHLILPKINSENLMFVIKPNDNNGFIPFQPRILDLVNVINLHHGSHLITRVVLDHKSKARHKIDHCIDFRLKSVIIELLWNNNIEKWCKENIEGFHYFVQCSHAPTCSWSQVPPSVCVTQCSSSELLIFICWC